MEKVASLAEIRSSWTIEDVADANDMLNYMAAQQNEASQAAAAPAPEMEPAVAAMIGRRR